MEHKKIVIKRLKQNNLKNISLDIPKQKIVVFTGVSGSGKSSIVFDTIAAESQRQMNETYTACILHCDCSFHGSEHRRLDRHLTSLLTIQTECARPAQESVK